LKQGTGENRGEIGKEISPRAGLASKGWGVGHTVYPFIINPGILSFNFKAIIFTSELNLKAFSFPKNIYKNIWQQCITAVVGLQHENKKVKKFTCYRRKVLEYFLLRIKRKSVFWYSGLHKMLKGSVQWLSRAVRWLHLKIMHYNSRQPF
jgi:hypothetical protein